MNCFMNYFVFLNRAHLHTPTHANTPTHTDAQHTHTPTPTHSYINTRTHVYTHTHQYIRLTGMGIGLWLKYTHARRQLASLWTNGMPDVDDTCNPAGRGAHVDEVDPMSQWTTKVCMIAVSVCVTFGSEWHVFQHDVNNLPVYYLCVGLKNVTIMILVVCYIPMAFRMFYSYNSSSNNGSNKVKTC